MPSWQAPSDPSSPLLRHQSQPPGALHARMATSLLLATSQDHCSHAGHPRFFRDVYWQRQPSTVACTQARGRAGLGSEPGTLNSIWMELRVPEGSVTIPFKHCIRSERKPGFSMECQGSVCKAEAEWGGLRGLNMPKGAGRMGRGARELEEG